MARPVNDVDVGYRSAQEFWDEIVLAAAGRFETQPTRAHAMACAIYITQFFDWVFHEKFPGEDTRHNVAYAAFKQKHFAACAELGWLADLSDAVKHRGLGRRDVALKQLRGGEDRLHENPIELELIDGTRHRFAAVVTSAVDYWRDNR
jgi:hypothetical protein